MYWRKSVDESELKNAFAMTNQHPKRKYELKTCMTTINAYPILINIIIKIVLYNNYGKQLNFRRVKFSILIIIM